ncbi:THO complex [Nesidiocoris tenuis]|uniref:THO complex n=1 Tax=Nesidiocoris tenuis TaxID=355587 RepID=A0ABN7BCY6_9HEMI|nr:THO complex [Nesidiocoris tenuis]
MNDEEIIRKRLLVDGDATGDERRIYNLLKKFMKWSSKEGDNHDVTQMRDQLLAQVAQCEYAYLKSRLTASMTSAELENYDNSSNQIESEINNIKSNIAATKEDLKEARIIRKNRVECDVLINIIKEQPDRQNTSATLENLKSDLQNLEERYEQLEKMLDMRKKQFHVMFASLHHLQCLLESDNPSPESTAVIDISMDDDVEMKE